MKAIPVQSIKKAETITASFDDLINMEWYVFKGWKNLVKIQKDKSIDFAVVFFQDQKMNNLPNLSKINSSKIIPIFGMKGHEDAVFKHIKDNIKNMF